MRRRISPHCIKAWRCHAQTALHLLRWRGAGLLRGAPPRRIRQAFADYRLIRASGLFDGRGYVLQDAAVPLRFRDPLWHYVLWGGPEGRDPHPLFAGAWYLAQNGEVARAGQNPLVHYLRHGAAAGLDPHPLFASAWYLEQNPDVASRGLNPLVHYVRVGGAEGRDPHPLFDTAYFLQSAAGAGMP